MSLDRAKYEDLKYQSIKLFIRDGDKKLINRLILAATSCTDEKTEKEVLIALSDWIKECFLRRKGPTE